MIRHSAIVGVAVLITTLVGCGEDGPDAPGAAFAAANDGSAAAIQIIAAAPDDGHDDAPHDEPADAMDGDGEVIHDEAEESHDDAEAAHDAEESHDDGADGHDEEADGHDDAEATHDDADHDDSADDADAGHDDAEATHDDSSAGEHDGFVVDVEMVEFGYVLDTAKVPMGEPITFRFRNTGDVEHEAMFGSAHQQTEYAAADGHGDGHGGDSHHGGVAAITLGAGETGEMVLSFDEPDEIWIGCHIEGHWDAGMQTTFEIA